MELDDLCRELGVVPAPAMAKLLALEESTLTQWHKTGRGPTRFRVGRQYFYRLGDVKAFLDCPEASTGDAEIALLVAGELS